MAVHLTLMALATVVASGAGREAGERDFVEPPHTIQLNGKSGVRLPGRDGLFEVLSGDGMPIRLAGALGDPTVGLAWWAPSVGLWIAIDRLPPAHSSTSLEVSLQVGDAVAEPMGRINVDETGSGRIVVIWPRRRPTAGVPVTLTVSEPGFFWQARRPSPILAGGAPMRE